MKLKTIAYAAFIAAAAAAFVIGSGGPSEAKAKKMAPPPPHPGPCFEDRRAGLRREGRHEVHLRERMLRGQGRRQGGFARRLPEPKRQEAQEGQEEGQAGEEDGKEAGHEEAGRTRKRRKEEDVAAPSFDGKKNGPLRMQRPVSVLRPARLFLARRNLQHLRDLLLGQRLVQEFELHRVARWRRRDRRTDRSAALPSAGILPSIP